MVKVINSLYVVVFWDTLMLFSTHHAVTFVLLQQLFCMIYVAECRHVRLLHLFFLILLATALKQIQRRLLCVLNTWCFAWAQPLAGVRTSPKCGRTPNFLRSFLINRV